MSTQNNQMIEISARNPQQVQSQNQFMPTVRDNENLRQDCKYSLLKPLDLVLNLRFQNGNYMKPRRALEAYGEEVVVQKEGFEEDRKGYQVTCDRCYEYKSKGGKCEDDQQIFQICDCSRKIYKAQRVLDYRDGLLYMLGKNKGKTKMEMTEQQQKEKEKRREQKLKKAGKKIKNSDIKVGKFSKIHRTQMLICVTMYNESLPMLKRTLGGIQENLEGFEQMGVGSDQIAVVVMQDGIEKNTNAPPMYKEFDKELGLVSEAGQDILDEYERLEEDRGLLMSRTYEARMKVINEGKTKISDPKKIAANQNFPLNVQKNIAQVYQTKCDFIGENETEEVKNKNKKLTVFFCNKHLNGRKLSSHMWFFQGFCRYLNPKYLALIDVGTQPHKMGLVNYFKAMEADKNIGGVSGFMGLYFDSEPDETKTWQQNYGQNSKSHRFSSNFLKPGTSQDNVERRKELVSQQKGEIKKLEAQKQEIALSKIKEEEKEKKYQEINEKMTVCNDIIKDEKYISPEQLKKQRGCWYCIMNAIYQLFCKIHLGFDIRRAQVVEYAIAHLLDKNFEAQFRFLNVLPGAWSAYRFKALTKAHEYKEDILEKRYLITYLQPDNKELESSIEASNMYLAEDRLLCLALFTQEGSQYTLKYVPDALAKTDAIDNNIEFMGQRRRWINSSYFAFNYVYRNYSDHMKDSSHHFLVKFGTHIMMFLSRLNQYNAYYMVAFYSFVIYTCATQMFIPLFDKYKLPTIISLVPSGMLVIYVLLIILLVFLSLNYKVDKKNDNYKMYNFVSGMFGLYNFLITIFTAFSIVDKFILQSDYLKNEDTSQEENDTMKTLVLIMAIISGGAVMFLIGSLIVQGRQGIRIMGEIVFSFWSYFYFSATYSHTLVIYSFCNIDDFSWGTKGSNSSEGDSSFNDQKNDFVAAWMFKNAFLCYILIALNELLGGTGYVLLGIGFYAIGQIAFKFVFAIWYHLKYFLVQRCWYSHKAKKNREVYENQSKVISTEINTKLQESWQKAKKEDKDKQAKREEKIFNMVSKIDRTLINQLGTRIINPNLFNIPEEQQQQPNNPMNDDENQHDIPRAF